MPDISVSVYLYISRYISLFVPFICFFMMLNEPLQGRVLNAGLMFFFLFFFLFYIVYVSFFCFSLILLNNEHSTWPDSQRRTYVFLFSFLFRFYLFVSVWLCWTYFCRVGFTTPDVSLSVSISVSTYIFGIPFLFDYVEVIINVYFFCFFSIFFDFIKLNTLGSDFQRQTYVFLFLFLFLFLFRLLFMFIFLFLCMFSFSVFFSKN